MSIFKNTFKQFVKDQITARQDLLASDTSRDIAFQQYVSANSPWARMVSFVDYKAPGDFRLAQNYTLFGGTLYNERDAGGRATGKVSLRSGIYGNSEILKGAAYGSTLGDRGYGLRPMPGIESVNVRSLGAYGSLRETTIKYYAWDLTQLENLNILYMKPGYPVLVEWGWSLYLDNTRSINKDFVLLKPFNLGLTLDGIYKDIYKKVETYKGNYDASIGLIKNYSYTLMPNGGFECVTTLISMGEVIDSIKVSNVSNKLDIKTTNSDDEFVTLLTAISNFKYESDSTENDVYFKFKKGTVQAVNPRSEIENSNPVNFVLPINQLPYSKFKQLLDTATGDTTIYTFGRVDDTKKLPGGDIRYTKFISLTFFIQILNSCTNLFISKGGTLSSIEVPFGLPEDFGNGYCLSSTNAISINNDVCIISNGSAELFDKQLGFIPQTSPRGLQRDFYDPYVNLGNLSGIYLNIGNIISTYKQMHESNQGSVELRPFLQKILDDVAYTLGSINNFDIISIDNKGVIVDKHYVEDPNSTGALNKFELNIMGINSTVKEHKVVSKIFEEQSTMIAIAAQDRANVASLQSSTQVALNKNIYNRLYLNSSDRESLDESENRDIIYKNIQSLFFFAKRYIVTGARPVYSEVTLSALNTYLNQLLTVADRATDFKAIIPISLEVKMDGISGITIGEIFRINASVLPSEYKDKDVGFIVTGIGQEIIRSDWHTTLTTQICLLNQNEKNEVSIAKAKEFYEGLAQFYETSKVTTSIAINYYNILLAFLEDFFTNRYIVKNILGDATLDYASGIDQSEKAAFNQIVSYGIDGGDLEIFKKEFGSLTKQGFTSYRNPSNRFEISSTLPSGNTSQVLLSEYLAWDEPVILDAGDNQQNTYEKLPIKNNIKRYLDYVVKSSLYYKQLSQNSTEIRELFDNVYAAIISKYFSPDSPTTYSRIIATLSIIIDSVISNREAVEQNILHLEGGKYRTKYLNPQSLDPEFQKIVPEKLYLEKSANIDFGIISD
jgi:hypothetical protein